MQIKSVLIVQGSYGDMHEPAWNRALNELGVKSELMETHHLTLAGLLGRIERRVLCGPGIRAIQNRLLSQMMAMKTDVVLLYQGHYFDAKVVKKVRDLTFVTGFHNDDPFGPRRNMLRYRLMLPALPYYQGFHVYRASNVSEAVRLGVKNVSVLRPYFLPWLDYPRVTPRDTEGRWSCDVVFAGHAENDLRVDCLSQSVKKGFRTKIYGEDRFWCRILPRSVYQSTRPILKVEGETYRVALCAAKIACCFLSKWNRDQYTRRVFEIPACGVFLLCERTPVMQELYVEGMEAEFFSSPDEFIDKVKFYLSHDDLRAKIAQSGHQKVLSGHHDIHSRMRQWLNDVFEWRRAIYG
jgi:spore maturation protein CgeB